MDSLCYECAHFRLLSEVNTGGEVVEIYSCKKDEFDEEFDEPVIQECLLFDELLDETDA